jgi:hypothetical protein
MKKNTTNLKSKQYKHECSKCDYHTDKLFNFNKHLETKSHLEKHYGCVKCKKLFRDVYNLNKHLNRITSCVKTIDQPITINITDNSINITDNSDNSINSNNGQYIKFNPTDFKGTKFKLLRTIKQNSELGYYDETNIQELKKNILLLLDKANFEEIKENKITDDILNTNDKELISSKISKYNKLCNSNKLLKNIAPTISQLASNLNCIGNKLRLYPHLVSDQEVNDETAELNEFKKENTEKVNLFITDIMAEALINTNMNLEDLDKLSIVEYRNKICVKYNKSELELFDLTKLTKITKIIEDATNIIREIVDSKLINFDLIKLDDKKIIQDLKDQFNTLLNTYDN